MNIVFGNQKGGVGKTTHAILLSNYLVLEKQMDLLILDLDFQGSIKMKWEQDLEIYDNPPLYEVMQLDLEEISSIFAKLNNTKGCVIFDLPGKIDDNNLISVYQNADLVICPFSYDKLTFESTIVFAQVIRHVNMEVPIVFLPNRLKSSVNYALKEKVNEAFSSYGSVAPEITDRISLQRLDCFNFSIESKSILSGSYDWIYHSFLHKTESNKVKDK
jgi:chromosome partitioning protein